MDQTFVFSVDSVAQVSECKKWIESVMAKVESEAIADFADFCLSWMSSVSRIIALSKAKQLQLERFKVLQSALIVHKNIQSMVDLKYRVIDMLCVTDATYTQYAELDEAVNELLCMSENLWTILELAVRTTYKLIEAKKRETALPGINSLT